MNAPIISAISKWIGIARATNDCLNAANLAHKLFYKLALPREAHEFKQIQQLSSEFGMRAWH